MSADESLLAGPVLVIGAGLLGTSVGLALARSGVPVLFSDVNGDHVRTAEGLGAGHAWRGEAPQVVVVAVPPDHLGETIQRALSDTDAVVTDVGSVKGGPLRAVGSHPRLAAYVGGHPMAGSERSGPLAASEALFDGRPWAVAPHPQADPEAVALVTALAGACGAVPLVLGVEEHDRAVARTSHLPHLMSVLTAGRLVDAPHEHLALSGQGIRDVTRIAESDPDLWQQILTGNARAVLALLLEVREDLDAVIQAVEEGARDRLAVLLDAGVAGTRAIPGKHGGPVRPTTTVFVSVPDAPGSLARLFGDAGEAGVNIEDVRIDHDPGRATGLVEVLVDHDRADDLLSALESRGWVAHR